MPNPRLMLWMALISGAVFIGIEHYKAKKGA